MTPLGLRVLAGHGPVYTPGADGPWPGVVILHGSEGPGAGWSHRFAAILAAHGFAALPLAYGAGDVWGAGDIRDVDLGPVARAATALAAQADVGSVGLLGWSRGGEAALLVAAHDPGPVAAVAVHAPPDRIMTAFDAAAFRQGTWHDRFDPAGGRAWRLDGADLTPGTPIDMAAFAGPVAITVGSADRVLDPAMSHALADRRRAAGRSVDLKVFDGQDHALGFDVEPQLWAYLAAFFGRALA